MDGLIYTPRRTDFLKDGSIFAQSPAIAPRFPVADTNNRFVLMRAACICSESIAYKRLHPFLILDNPSPIYLIPAGAFHCTGPVLKVHLPVRIKPLLCLPLARALLQLRIIHKRHGPLLLRTLLSCLSLTKMTLPSRSEQSLKTLCVPAHCQR